MACARVVVSVAWFAIVAIYWNGTFSRRARRAEGGSYPIGRGLVRIGRQARFRIGRAILSRKLASLDHPGFGSVCASGAKKRAQTAHYLKEAFAWGSLGPCRP